LLIICPAAKPGSPSTDSRRPIPRSKPWGYKKENFNGKQGLPCGQLPEYLFPPALGQSLKCRLFSRSISARTKGVHMLTQEEITSLDEILSSHDYDSSSVIAVMQDIQKKYRYLPEEALTYIAGKLKLSEAKIYGVATFYENFSLEPKGRYVIKVCDGTACHVRKSIPILEEFRNILGLSETKHNSDDMLFTLETVSCLGACGLAPVCTVNDKVHAAMTPEKARELISELREEAANEN
jgi:NADH-quinone oxidoreductase subunit E